MKILIYDGTLNPPTFVKALATNLANQDCKVFLAGKADGYCKPEKDSKLQYLPVYYRKIYWLIVLLIISFFKLLILRPNKFIFTLKCSFKKKSISDRLFTFIQFAQIYSLNPTIIHLQWSTHIDLFKDIIDDNSFKFIVSFRGRLINVSPFIDSDIADLYRSYFPKIDGFHAVSEAILSNGALFGANKKIASVIKPAVKDSLFTDVNIVSPLNKRNEKLKILSVGRFHWKKGYYYALDACKILKDKGVDFEYTIIAGGDSEEIVFGIDDLDLRDNVRLINNIPHHKVIESFNAADVFVLPSLEEGIANVALEAMTMGVPVISTDCGGMKELIEHGINGWIVPTADSQSLAEEIERFLSMGEKAKDSIITNARSTIKRSHLQSNQTHNMMDLYKQVASDAI